MGPAFSKSKSKSKSTPKPATPITYRSPEQSSYYHTHSKWNGDNCREYNIAQRKEIRNISPIDLVLPKDLEEGVKQKSKLQLQLEVARRIDEKRALRKIQVKRLKTLRSSTRRQAIVDEDPDETGKFTDKPVERVLFPKAEQRETVFKPKQKPPDRLGDNIFTTHARKNMPVRNARQRRARRTKVSSKAGRNRKRKRAEDDAKATSKTSGNKRRKGAEDDAGFE